MNQAGSHGGDVPGAAPAGRPAGTVPGEPLATGGLAAGWSDIVDAHAHSVEGRRLAAFLADRHAAGARVFPPDPWRVLRLVARAEVRVVILGQDPYHGAGQAHGLAFSVPDGIRPPPSLRNVLRELHDDLGCPSRGSGNLEAWVRQGVLLLNTVLTVEEGAPASHAGRGWEALTDALIGSLAHDPASKVFLLWGAHAQAQRERIAAAGNRHTVLAANHPSPLSARRGPVPFLGCRHFSAANRALAEAGRAAIDWCAA